MILIVGPLCGGKRATAMQILQCDEQELARHEAIIATEVGCGVVPADAEERAAREAAGRLCCLLAQRADTVMRVFCGIPVVIKGGLS